MKFVLQESPHGKGSERMAWALRSQGIDFVAVSLCPYSGKLLTEVNGIDLIPYGSVTLIQHAVKKGWRGVWFDLEKLSVESWLTNRNDMLNADGEFMTARQAAELLPLFIRPSGDLKSFNGGVATKHEKGFIIGAGRRPHPSDTVFAAPLKTIFAEWRCFVVGGQIVSVSLYKGAGDQPDAQAFADKWLPLPNCVMDLALTDNGIKVIEFNCINASGMYADHDPVVISNAMLSKK